MRDEASESDVERGTRGVGRAAVRGDEDRRAAFSGTLGVFCGLDSRSSYGRRVSVVVLVGEFADVCARVRCPRHVMAIGGGKPLAKGADAVGGGYA